MQEEDAGGGCRGWLQRSPNDYTISPSPLGPLSGSSLRSVSRGSKGIDRLKRCLARPRPNRSPDALKGFRVDAFKIVEC